MKLKDLLGRLLAYNARYSVYLPVRNREGQESPALLCADEYRGQESEELMDWLYGLDLAVSHFYGDENGMHITLEPVILLPAPGEMEGG